MRYVVNNDGMLTLGGIAADQLTKEFGSPLYVMEEEKIIGSMKKYTDALKKYYDNNGLIIYASKAFCCLRMCKLASDGGLGLDVVSGGEMFTAKSAGFDMKNACLHGNNKTENELKAALNYGVGRIVVDNIPELERLNNICQSLGKTADILFRIKPGVEAHTHDYIQTGRIDSKFGIALETGEAMEAVKAALKYKNLNLRGLHCHIGSQILVITPFEDTAKIMIKFMADIKRETGITLPELNLGGGFGISYTPNEVALNIDECVKKTAAAISSASSEFGVDKPFLMLEPGRSIVGESGTTLYTIGSIKHIPNVRTYVAVDGGMTDNPRYALYKAQYEMLIANKANQPQDTIVTIAGKCCESGDLLGENVALQKAEVGDILAVRCTGAYNYSMFSHYNRTLRPPVVMVSNAKAQLAVRGDTLSDLIAHDIK